jgi:hypothetical protein
MQTKRISHGAIPVKLIACLLVVAACGAALAYYGWQTFTIPIEIKEPIELLSYPSQLSLYPGEILDFNVTIRNLASINYSAALVFHLNNVTYQSKYVTFDNENYTVTPGQQNLTTWLKVESDAIPISDSLNIEIMRLANAQNGADQLAVTGITWNWGASGSRTFQVTVNNTGTEDTTIQQIMVNYVGIPGALLSPSLPYILKASGTQSQRSVSFTITYDYNNGTNYDISVVTSDGYRFTNTFQGGTNVESQVGIFLSEDAVNWQTGKMVIYVRNTGTSDATIDAVYIGLSGNLTLQTSVAYAPSSKIAAKNGGTIAITVNYAWSSKITYYFRIAPVVGNALSFEEEAP